MATDTTQLREIEHGLSTLEARAAPVLESVLPLLRELLSGEASLAYRPTWSGNGWSTEFLHLSARGKAESTQAQFAGYLGRAPRRFGLYDPMRPEPGQRNVVVSSNWADCVRVPFVTGFQDASPLAGHSQLRILLCEGPSLLGWVGVFRLSPFRERQIRLLARLGPAFHRRLLLERRLSQTQIDSLGLAAALEAITAPAFIIGAGTGVRHANAGGRALIDHEGGPLVDAVSDHLLGRGSLPRGISITTLSAPGLPKYVLAIVEGREAEWTARLAQAKAQWQLTARQAEVLACVAEGLPNKLIADRLKCAVRTVEVHLTAIFDKASVTSRSELMRAMCEPNGGGA